MAVQSIRAPVQIRDVAGDHLFVSAGKMPFGEMDGVSHFDDAAQKIRPRSEALDNARNLLSSRTGSPRIVSGGGLSRGVRVFDDSDLRGWFYGLSIIPALRHRAAVFFIVFHPSNLST
jgi:hypothetical protein